MYDPDLFPQNLPEGWIPGEGKHMGAMVIFETPNQTIWNESVRAAIHEAGGEVENVYFTYLIKHADGSVEASLPYLKEEIQFTVPRFILALGELTYQTLTGSVLGIELYRGLWQRLDEQFDWDEAVVMPTYDQGVLFAKQDKVIQLQRDIYEFVKAWKESYVSEDI